MFPWSDRTSTGPKQAPDLRQHAQLPRIRADVACACGMLIIEADALSGHELKRQIQGEGCAAVVANGEIKRQFLHLYPFLCKNAENLSEIFSKYACIS